QVARWPWNAWPDESGLGGRMAWNPHLRSNASNKWFLSCRKANISQKLTFSTESVKIAPLMASRSKADLFATGRLTKR
ncbi:hypothetical protein QOT38_30590, partial [Pseudomonas aeruginosa]